LPVVVQATTIDGKDVLIPRESLEKMTTDTSVEIICDQCGASLKWNQEEVAESSDALPDASYRVVTISDANGQTSTFCGLKCLIEAAKKMTPLKSPREKAGVIDIATYRKPVRKMDEGVFA
jgi:hypothetical protein